MTERLDALSVRESNGKAYFTRIGVAFPAKAGTGWTVLLDAMPAPVDGQFKILLREPQQREQRRDDGLSHRNQDGFGGGRTFNDPDDDVPFISMDIAHENKRRRII